jgi:MinD-like ATPase involved in chromosome partitioning or flagellar assembly
VELPTYTNIWKIEKRLYKLYDFRLPMPLPVGQIAAFLAIAVPYTVILTMAGMPFSHTWVWLYVLPPAVLAWLVTRPVLEGKRLPELVLSQLRYLSEPRTWCRMAPLAEKDHVVVFARIWRSDHVRSEVTASSAIPPPLAAETAPAEPAEPAEHSGQPAQFQAAAESEPDCQSPAPPECLPADESRPEPWPQPNKTTPAVPDASHEPDESAGSQLGPRISEEPIRARDRERLMARSRSAVQGRDGPAPGSGAESRPPSVRVTNAGSQARSLNVVERALRTSPAEPGMSGRPQPVVLVPGGHRPGKPDPLQRDQARSRLPLPGPARVVVVGCAAGAGQTTTTLLTGQLLSALRAEAVAVVDFSMGAESLTAQARLIPVLLPRTRVDGAFAGHDTPAGGERGLHVVATNGVMDAEALITSVVTRYPITLADPDAGSVPRALRVTDQLVLVARAGAEAAMSVASTLEWLEVHDHVRLAASAVVVMNGVNQASREHIDKAAAVVSGRVRAVVRVPWDDGLATRSDEGLSAGTVRAYTALAGVVVASLADAASRSAVR